MNADPSIFVLSIAFATISFVPLPIEASPALGVSMRHGSESNISLRAGLPSDERMTAPVCVTNTVQALLVYSELTGRQLLPRTNTVLERLDDVLSGRLSKLGFQRPVAPDAGITIHRDGQFTAGEVKEQLEAFFRTNGVMLVPEGNRHFRLQSIQKPQQGWSDKYQGALTLLFAFLLVSALAGVRLMRRRSRLPT